jgi:hypothetical protein
MSVALIILSDYPSKEEELLRITSELFANGKY